MKNSYNLVLIDMQDIYLKHIADTNDAQEAEDIVHHCEKEIKEAVKNKQNILIVEFNHYGPTHHKLMRCIPDGYKKAHVIVKEHQDGSEKILEICRKHRLSKNTFRVCGVYLSACVLETVRGLLKQINPKIQVLSTCSAHPRMEMRNNYNSFKEEFESLSENVCFI